MDGVEKTLKRNIMMPTILSGTSELVTIAPPLVRVYVMDGDG
jgi:hypothetical protein